MLSKSVLAASLMALTMVPGAATAQQAALPASGPQAQTNWTGFYGGVFGGISSAELDVDGCVGLCPDPDDRLTGGFGGIQAGYDFQLDNGVVVGGFGQFELVGPNSEIGPFGDTLSQKFAATAAARVGFVYGDLLPYAFAGVRHTSIELDAPGIADPIQTNSYLGAVGGVGLEYVVTEGVSFDARYTYTHLPAETFDFGTPGGGEQDYGFPSGSSFQAGINFRF